MGATLVGTTRRVRLTPPSVPFSFPQSSSSCRPDAATTVPNPPRRSGTDCRASPDRSRARAAPAFAAPRRWPESRIPAAAAHFQQSALAAELRSRSHVLPAQQPAHELRRRDRLHLLAQPADRQAMNARQQPPVAPLRGRSVSLSDAAGRCSLVEAASVHWKFPRRIAPVASRRSNDASISVAPNPERVQLRGRHRPDVAASSRAAATRSRAQARCSRFAIAGGSGSNSRLREQRHGTPAPRSDATQYSSPVGYCRGATSSARASRDSRSLARTPLARSAALSSAFPDARSSFLPSAQARREREDNQRLQRVVQFVGVAHVGPGLLAHFLDGGGIEPANLAQHASGSVRRISTARARRSSSGASSRNA